MNAIEIFPEESGCPAGCSLCSLGNNPTKQIKKKEVDKNIILTFKLVEKIFYKNDMYYWIPYSGRTEDLFDNLSAMITHPQYLMELRLSMEYKVNLKNYDEHFILIKNQYEKLSNKFEKLRLVTFGLVFTPQNPYKINTYERKFIYKYFDFLYRDLFKDRNQIFFEIEAHSNMVNTEKWLENNHALNKHDNLFMNRIEQEIPDSNNVKKVIRNKIEEIGDDHLFYKSRLLIQNQENNTFVYSNRIISPLLRGETSVNDLNLQQAKELLGENKDEIIFSLTPQGVMIKHSSIRINNPVIWFGHTDFRRAVNILTKKGKSIFEIQQILLEQNYNLMIDNPNLVNYRKSMDIFAKLRYEKFKEIY